MRACRWLASSQWYEEDLSVNVSFFPSRGYFRCLSSNNNIMEFGKASHSSTYCIPKKSTVISL